MKIRGIEYGFAYTVGAHCAVMDLKFDPELKSSSMRSNIYLASIMSKAYEDRERLYDPEYEKHYLTVEMIEALEAPEMNMLMKEVRDAYKKGNGITVKTSPKTRGTAK